MLSFNKCDLKKKSGPSKNQYELRIKYDCIRGW